MSSSPRKKWQLLGIMGLGIISVIGAIAMLNREDIAILNFAPGLTYSEIEETELERALDI